MKENLNIELKERYSKRKSEIISRLNDFKNVKNEDLFYELCFCLLTPQCPAKKADAIVQELKKADFRNKNINVHDFLKTTRFHNNRAKYFSEMKSKYNFIEQELKEKISTEKKRDFLVENVKGIGLKEAGHFLRNTGHENLAILDRHILKHLAELKVIEEVPKTLTKKKYLDIERKFKEFSKKINIPMDHLDLLFWSMETREIFK